MTTILFLAEWAVRSSILILSGALLLPALRVKDPSTRLAAWTAMLCGSLAIPAITAALPRMPLAVMRVAAPPVDVPVVVYAATPAPAVSRQADSIAHGSSRPFDWALAAMMIYVLIASALLLRLCAGLAMSRRLLCSNRATGQATEGIEIRESDRVASPVALGIMRPAILLPSDWREWDSAKLDAVLAHERSHIRRRDPAVQLLSAIHRALLWHSPLSWFLHRRIVRVAEEVSDDAAVAAIRDRASYAEVLLDFMQRAVPRARCQGVPMARYGAPAERIHRILDGTALSHGVTRWSIVAILALGAPLAYLVAAAHPQRTPRAEAKTASAVEAAEPASDAPVDLTVQIATPQPAPVQAAPVQAAAPQQGAAVPPSTEKPLIFDAASVKPYTPPPPSAGRGGGGGTGGNDPGRIHYSAVRLKDLLIAAYDVKNFQIVGPAWLDSWDDSERFVIDAIMPPDTTKDQRRVMFQSLLAERFELKIHRETRALPVYSLVVAKNGPKMKESVETPTRKDDAQAAPPPPGGRGRPGFDADGFPISATQAEGRAGTWEWIVNGRCRVGGNQATMQDLANQLAREFYLNSTVTDETALKAKYDYTLTFASIGFNGIPPEGLEPLPDLFSAVQSQLGLKLEMKRGPVEVIVIDHIEKAPTEN